MEESYCYNLNLAENRSVTLEELLGENWVEICNDVIRAGILDLSGGALQELPPFIGERIVTLQGFMNTAVNLRQLFLGK